MATYQVKPQILDWVVRTTDLEPEKLLKKTEKYPIVLWKEEKKIPTINQLQEFAKDFHIPFGYLFLDNPPVQQNPNMAFRTVENRPAEISRGFQETIYTMQTRQEWMKDELLDNGIPPLELVGMFSNEQNADKISFMIRELLELEEIEKNTEIDKFYRLLKEKISSIGVLVMQNGTVNGNGSRKLAVKEVRAFVLIDNYAPLIFINTNDAQSARVFSLVHEFVHITRGDDEVLHEANVETKEEQFVNRIVEQILMPEEDFRKSYKNTSINKLAKKYHVSSFAAGIRALHLNLINQQELDKIKQEQFDFTIVDKSGGGNPYWTALSRVDSSFTDRLINSYSSGETTPTEATHLLGISVKMFPRFVREFQERYEI